MVKLTSFLFTVFYHPVAFLEEISQVVFLQFSIDIVWKNIQIGNKARECGRDKVREIGREGRSYMPS